MKKLSLFSAVLLSLLTATIAEAEDGAYVGADIGYVTSGHKFSDRSGTYGDENTGLMRGYSMGVGLNAGYKIGFADQFFVAPEIFYDYLNNKAGDFYRVSNPSARQDSMEITSRYGAKGNLGYNFNSKFSGFVNLGIAKARYVTNGNSINYSYSKSKIAPIYGIGLSYNLDKHWTIKTSYDYQKFNTTSYYAPYRDTVSLSVVKVGASYSF